MRIVILCMILESLIFIQTNSQDFNRQEYFNILKQDTIEFNELFYQDVCAKTTKQKLLKELGNPDSIVAPNYECGGFSGTRQGMNFYQYHYKSLNYIGAGENLILENVDFAKDTTVVLIYKGFELSHNSNIKEFERLFPKSYLNRTIDKKDSRVERLHILPELVSDDMIILTFRDGFLVKYWFWSPC